MRIAFVYDTVYPESKGGVEKRIWELARRLVQRGHEVHLLVPKAWAGPSQIEREGALLQGVCQPRPLYTSSGRRAVWPSLAHAVGVFRFLRNQSYDLVDCQTPAHLAVLAAWRRSRRRPGTRVVITWHEAWDGNWREEMGLLGHIGRSIERLVARLPATHVAVSQDTADVLAGLGRRASAVIPSGVESPRTHWSEPSNVALSDILFVGRLVPSKNLELLIEAVDLLVGKGLSPRVIVVGDGPQKKTWQDLVDHLGLNDCIEFVDAVKTESDVAALLESTRVLAAPSVREGFGMIVLEALAHGVPVVTVDHPRNAARHLVHHGVTGLVVPPMPGPFADALELLQEDQGLREKMAREAMDVARGATWDASLESTEAVYEARVA